MDLGIANKKALVTGGAVGIGQAIAMDLAKEGAKVVITSRDKDKLSHTFSALGGRGAGHYAIHSDLTEEGAPAQCAGEIQQNFGDLDIVVNNIGSTLGITDPHCPISDWKKVYRLVLEVAVEMNNLFLPYMMRNQWGRIVNITAGAAMENSGPVPYCSMKSALTAYTRSMARILATESGNVVMSAVLPGVVLTEGGHWDTVLKERPEHAEKYLEERCPLKRFGEPSEISPMVVLLCSSMASFCHGSIVLVDAGQAKHYHNVDGF